MTMAVGIWHNITTWHTTNKKLEVIIVTFHVTNEMNEINRVLGHLCAHIG